jgi:phosphatidylserine/phosphatidylglycerophosphate/cardiolipin synthase-like enzyme/V8-like Glu-specific endopeptidase
MRTSSSLAYQRAAAGEISEADELPYSLDRLFQALVYGSDSLALRWLLERFEVVALPGAGLEGKLERGDLILRGGDGPLVHAFLVADAVMRSAEEILRQAGRPEVAAPGAFVYVAEQGVVPHTEEDRFARRVTDESGRARRRQAVLRAREGGGEGERVDLTSLMVGMTLANAASRPRDVVRVELNTKEDPAPNPPVDESLPWADSGEADGPAERPCTGIIGGDNRRPVARAWDAPFRWICQISSRQRKNGTLQRLGPAGTGLLISPRFVLTAAHLLRDSERDEHNQWVDSEAEQIMVTPAADSSQNESSRSPFGQHEALRWRLCPKYDPRDRSKHRFDYALIELKKPIGAAKYSLLGNQRLCFWGSEECGGNTVLKILDPGQLAGVTAYSAGYPADLGGGTRPYTAEGRLSSVNVPGRPEVMNYDADGCPGQSGSPVWVELTGKRCLAGLFTKVGTVTDATTHRVTGNEAVRFSREVFQQISKWMEESREDPWLYHADSERAARGAESLALADDTGPSDPHRWATLLAGAERTKVEPLIDGAAAFRAMRDAIQTANGAGHFIYILGWMFDINLPLVPGDSNSTLDELLTAAVRKGVQLRILIWDNLEEDYNKKAMDAIARLRAIPGRLGRRADLVAVHLDANNFLPKRSRELLQDIAPTVRDLRRIVKTYHRYLPSSLIPDDYYLARAAQFSDPHSTHSIGAHHEKVTIVNGSQGLIGFCGGIDYNCNRIGQGWCGPAFPLLPKTPSLHDVACRLQGPATRKLFEKFKTRWTHHPETSQESLIEPAAAAFALRDGQAGAALARVVGTYNSPDGSIRDRSLSHAYFKIIDAARKHIYIEDQYGVHPDVAKHLNARLRDPAFEQLIIVLQDASETSDVLIPNRKREEFRKALFSGLNDTQRQKAVFAIYDAAKAEQRHLHRGMHAKTLIVDDEIAIIGSANVNRRSFSCDSESSVVIIDDPGQAGQSIVRLFRRNTWKEHAGGAIPDSQLDNWVLFARYIGLAIPPWPSLLNIRRFDAPDALDLDVRVRLAVELAKGEGDLLSITGLPGTAIGGEVSKVAAWVLRVMPKAVEDLWNLIIDPNVDEQ